jgi:DNA-binding LacI/PurR family transcriptional regulator
MRRSNVRAFALASRHSQGAQIARHLVGLGHREGAFILPSLPDHGTQELANGFVDAFALAGSGFKAQWYVPPGVGGFPDMAARVEGSAILLDLKRLRSRYAVPTAVGSHYLDALFWDQEARKLASYREWSHYLEPLFGALLEQRSITAWACYNDDIALAACEFLRSHDIAIGTRISVVGIDDSRDAWANNITSYSFNLRAVVRAMLEHALETHVQRRRRENAPVTIQGDVVARGSSATPRGS